MTNSTNPTAVDISAQRTRAAAFRDLHQQGVLVLANAWDAASACIAVHAGAAAVATTSAGVAWSLGFPDGDVMPRDVAVSAIARIAAAIDIPLTADIEAGYGATLDELATTIHAVIAAGAVGINIEDAGGAGLREVPEQVARISTVRATAEAAGVELFINARTDTYLRGIGEAAGRLGATVERARAYVDAGADGIFVPGASDADVIRQLAAEISKPLNVMAGPGSLSVAELADLGVRRVSVGSATAQAAYDVARRAASELITLGSYGPLADGMDYGELNGLFARR